MDLEGVGKVHMRILAPINMQVNLAALNLPREPAASLPREPAALMPVAQTIETLSSLPEMTTLMSPLEMKPPIGGWRMLSVDDDEVNQEVIQGIFGPLGLELTIAMNGAECLAAVEEKSFHIVLLD